MNPLIYHILAVLGVCFILFLGILFFAEKIGNYLVDMEDRCISSRHMGDEIDV